LLSKIGPILAEGTRGNPRQIKRFLNTLSIRLAIAQQPRVWRSVKSSILGKLMLAERFQPTFYDQLAS
jgi:predicted KAP-like P-loop ATPase